MKRFERLTDSERQLALSAFAPNEQSRRWGNQLLEVYDAALREIERLRRMPRLVSRSHAPNDPEKRWIVFERSGISYSFEVGDELYRVVGVSPLEEALAVVAAAREWKDAWEAPSSTDTDERREAAYYAFSLALSRHVEERIE